MKKARHPGDSVLVVWKGMGWIGKSIGGIEGRVYVYLLVYIMMYYVFISRYVYVYVYSRIWIYVYLRTHTGVNTWN